MRCMWRHDFFRHAIITPDTENGNKKYEYGIFRIFHSFFDDGLVRKYCLDETDVSPKEALIRFTSQSYTYILTYATFFKFFRETASKSIIFFEV